MQNLYLHVIVQDDTQVDDQQAEVIGLVSGSSIHEPYICMEPSTTGCHRGI